MIVPTGTPVTSAACLVTEAIHSHEHQCRALVRRQTTDRPTHFGEREPGLDSAYRLIRSEPLLGDLAILLANIPRADLVDPDRLHDTKHPTVETRTFLKLMPARERPFAGGLDQIVRLDGRSGEPAAQTDAISAAPQSAGRQKDRVADPSPQRDAVAIPAISAASDNGPPARFIPADAAE